MMPTLTMLLLCAAPMSVSGQVHDTDGDPVAGATVELRERLIFDGPRRNENVGRATTDAAGRFTATLPFVPKLARATAADYEPTSVVFIDQWVAVPERGPVSLTLRKRRLMTASGSVVDEANAPIAGALVGPAQGDRMASTFTDAAGAFSLSLPAGTPLLHVYRKGYVAQDVPLTSTPMKVVMQKRPTLAVYLLDSKGQPIQFIQTVDALRADGSRIASCNTRPSLGDCTLEAELTDVTVTATVEGKTVKQVVHVEGTKKVDVTLRF